jgi:undecaprenyl diphosphate synthase
MDGNGRWATRRGLPRPLGHRAGLEAVRRVIGACRERGIPELTLFAFSSENWRRPAEEVGVLLQLFVEALRAEVGRLRDNGVRLRFIGNLAHFDPALQLAMRAAEAETAASTALRVNVAVNYGGRWDIVQAAQALAREVAAGRLRADDIDATRFGAALALADAAEPDLFIRTGGERRISNFLLWQLAYTELHFTEALWPDFGAADFERALADFAGRERRYGGVVAEAAGA